MAHVPNVPIVNAGLEYINGLEIDYNAGTPTVTVNAGQCRDYTNTNDIILPESVIVSGLKVGANGVDVVIFTSGAPAIYAVYAIGDSTDYYPGAALFSLDEDVPQLPKGYDMYRRIGYVRSPLGTTNVSKWYQSGSSSTRVYYYDLPFAQTLPSPLPTSYTLFNFQSPSKADLLILDIAFTPAVAGDLVEFLPFDSPAAIADPTTAFGCARFGGGALGVKSVAPVTILVDPLANSFGFVYPTALFKVSSASDTLVINAVGFVDLLI